MVGILSEEEGGGSEDGNEGVGSRAGDGTAGVGSRAGDRTAASGNPPGFKVGSSGGSGFGVSVGVLTGLELLILSVTTNRCSEGVG